MRLLQSCWVARPGPCVRKPSHEAFKPKQTGQEEKHEKEGESGKLCSYQLMARSKALRASIDWFYIMARRLTVLRTNSPGKPTTCFQFGAGEVSVRKPPRARRHVRGTEGLQQTIRSSGQWRVTGCHAQYPAFSSFVGSYY